MKKGRYVVFLGLYLWFLFGFVGGALSAYEKVKADTALLGWSD